MPSTPQSEIDATRAWSGPSTAVHGGAWRGREVPSPAAMGFRLERALNLGVADRGVMRDGNHYHDWYRRDPQ